MPSSILPGEQIAHYRILREIGRGGMGVVYLAEDTRLGRQVALKFLPPELTSDARALKRFEREARAASALNHPNICVIYDFGERDGQWYIAMELLDGKTLRDLIGGPAVSIEQFFLLAIQIADALTAAHKHGVIHRDLKPANILVTEHGAKVLDFGLAERLEEVPLGPDSETMSRRLTSAGMVVGTTGYMSPEQAAGDSLDARSDIFSFGTVLYEMATRRPAFAGNSRAEVLDSLLNKRPKSLCELNPNLPDELQPLLDKCLEKDRRLRYQSSEELLVDLKRLKRDSESREQLAALPRRRSLGVAIVAGVLVLGGLAAGLFWLVARNGGPQATSNFAAVTSFPDSAISPAISPDGRMLAFIRGEDTFFGPGQVYVKMLPNGEPQQLTHDQSLKISPAFSPDGSRIAYGTVGPAWDTWVVPTLGGEPRLMLANSSGLSWIDDQHVLFSEIKSGIHMSLETASESRSEQRDIYVPPRERGMAHRSYISPNHEWVLLAEMDNGGWMPCRLVRFDGSDSRQVGPANASCTSAAWSPDGKWMYLSANAGENFHIWRQRFPDGRPQQVTAGPGQEEGIAMMPDGNSFITSSGSVDSSLVVHDSRGERVISAEGYVDMPNFSPDDQKLYYILGTRGNGGLHDFIEGELWVADLATDRSERVFPGVTISSYSISPDGKTAAVPIMGKDGKEHIWAVSLERRFPPRQLTSGAGEDEPRFGGNGHIFYRQTAGAANYLYRMNDDGSVSQKAREGPILELNEVSPDESLAIALAPTPDQPQPNAEVALPLNGDPAPALITHGLSWCGWSGDGTEFYFPLPEMSQRLKDKTAVFRVERGKLPSFPLGRFETNDEIPTRNVRMFDHHIRLGANDSAYAFLQLSVHRNLYRVSIH